MGSGIQRRPLAHRIEEQSLRVERIDVLADLGDPAVPDLEDHDVVVLVGLALPRRRTDRHLDVDELLAGEARRPLDLHRPGRIVEAEAARHQREHGIESIVQASDGRRLRRQPTGVLREELGDRGIALLQPLEITIDEREIAGGCRRRRSSIHRITIA